VCVCIRAKCQSVTKTEERSIEELETKSHESSAAVIPAEPEKPESENQKHNVTTMNQFKGYDQSYHSSVSLPGEWVDQSEIGFAESANGFGNWKADAAPDDAAVEPRE
jgi:hypothetical protein